MTRKVLAVLTVVAATATIAAGVPRAFAGTPAHRTYEPVLDPADFVRVIEGQVTVTAHSGGGVLRRCRRHAQRPSQM